MIYKLMLIWTMALVVTNSGRCEDLDTDSVRVIDTVLYDGSGLLEHASPVTSEINFEKRLHQNPTVGLFKSLVVPGWGQIGNRRYMKAIVFAGLDAWFIGAAIHYGDQAADFRLRFESSEDLVLRRELYELYLDRKDERNKFTWFAVIITFVSMFDAYVDAHLSGYPGKADDSGLSLDISPTRDGGFLASISMEF